MSAVEDDSKSETPSAERDETTAAPEPTVCIILTNYNHAKYLGTSLGGIVGQSRPADEIIVIDDGSTDNSLEIIRKFAAEYPAIRIIENVQNRGVQYTIARALGAVTADYLVWAAADDKLLPTFLEESMAQAKAHPDAGVVFSQLATFNDSDGAENHHTGDNPSVAFYIGPEATHFSPQGLMERLTASYCWLSGNTAVVRRDCLFDIGAFIPALEWHSDWFAFYAVALRYGAVGIPKTLAMMRVVPETYSSAGMKQKDKQLAVMDAILDTIRQPEYADLRPKFRARPCLFSPFYPMIVHALMRRPKDWDLLIRFIWWAANRLGTQYANRSRFAKGWRKRSLALRGKIVKLMVRIIDTMTPASWKSEPA